MATNRDEIFQTVKTVVLNTVTFDGDVTEDTNFVSDLNLDSLDRVELVMALEEKLDIEITDQEAEGFRTVGNVVDFITNKQQ